MHGGSEAYAALYDTHAARLHAYCWSLVGDRAPDVVAKVITAMARPGARRGDVPLYGQARAECLRRGPINVISARDPLLRAAARLRVDQREALVLAANLEPTGAAQVLGVPLSSAVRLIQVARARLERAVIDILLPGPVAPQHDDVLQAFQNGTLGTLLALRAPAPPPGLRERIVPTTASAAPVAPEQDTQRQLVVISPARHARPHVPAILRSRAAAEAIGIAACVATAVGAFAAWPSPHDASSASGTGTFVATAPSTGHQGTPAAGGSGAGQPAPAQPPAAAPPTASPSPTVSTTSSINTTPVPTDPAKDPAAPATQAQAESAASESSAGPAATPASPTPAPAAGPSSPSKPPAASPTPSPGGGLLPPLPIVSDVVSSVLPGS